MEFSLMKVENLLGFGASGDVEHLIVFISYTWVIILFEKPQLFFFPLFLILWPSLRINVLWSLLKGEEGMKCGKDELYVWIAWVWSKFMES